MASDMHKLMWVLLLTGLLSSSASANETDGAFHVFWVVPHQDRLALVMPWDSNRPEEPGFCPAGETRQVWIDVDGRHLTPGRHRFWIVIEAERKQPKKTQATPTGEMPKAGGMLDAGEGAPAMPDDDGLLGRLNEGNKPKAIPPPTQADLRKRIEALAGEVEKRNYWHQWRGDKKPQKLPLPNQGDFAQSARASVAAGKRLPEYVLWTPSAWLALPQTVLPPALQSATETSAELTLDEMEPVCLTVTNLSENDMQFSVRVTDQEPRRTPKLTRLVALNLHVWNIRLPRDARMDVYTWNYGAASEPYLDFLRRMKCNWFTLSNPDFTIKDGELTCDFTVTDKTLAAVRPRGKGLFLWSALKGFNEKLRREYGVTGGDARYEPLLHAYLTQWMRHMQEKGWKPEEYAIQLWDEPGMKGYWDKRWVFELIHKATAIMRETEPNVQVMENPLMRFNGEFYDIIAADVAIWAPHGGTVYLTEDTREKTWADAKDLEPTSHRNSNFMNQMYFKMCHRKYGAIRWTYYQHRPDATRCPLGYFRHFPWKNKWMDFEGVSFWSSWYTTAGALENPIYLGTKKWWLHSLKGMYGWREGVEDIQYLELLDREIERLGDEATELRAVRERALKRVIDQGWWATDPWKLEEAMQLSRRELAEAIVRARRTGGREE